MNFMAKRNIRSTRKTSYRRRQPHRKGSSPVKWLLSGIVIGLIIPGYFLIKGPSKANTQIAQVEPSDVITDQSSALKQHTHKPPRKKEEQTSSHSNYEFYNLLSEEGAEAKSKPSSRSDHSYSLKLSSVTTYEQADQQKAQLALIGIEHVNISKSSASHSYIITLGPYATKEAAMKIKKMLKENDVSAELIKPTFD